MESEELEFLAHWITDFVERTRRDRHQRDVARLQGVYRAMLGAPVLWGKSDRRAVGLRITQAILPDLRESNGRARTRLEEIFSKVLALECEEPAFERLGAPWSPHLRRQLAGKARGPRHVFALLVVTAGAFGRERDRKAYFEAPVVMTEYRNIKAAADKSERNESRREKRAALKSVE